MKNAHTILSSPNVGRLLVDLSFPAMIGMLVQALYNVVDRIYIGQSIGSLGIAGITVVMPVQMFVLAIGSMIGVGAGSLISRSLGAHDQERAERAMGNLVISVVFLGVLLALCGYIFMDPLLRWFGATGDALPYARSYAAYIFFGNAFFAFAVATNNIIRAEGQARIAMGTMLVAAGLNIVLDPIFIFVFKMGVAGAAIATVLSQAAMALYVLRYFLSGRSSLKLHWRNMRPDFIILGEIFSVGSSAFARQAAVSLIFIAMNRTIKLYGDSGSIAAFGIVNSALQIMMMPLFGLAQGLQPVAGYNFGAKRWNLARKAVRLAILYATIICCVGFTVAMTVPGLIARAFTQDPRLIAETAHAMRLMAILTPLVGFQIIGASMFQAFGRAMPALLLTLSRQFLFVLPLLWILPRFFGLDGIWATFPCADLLSLLTTAWFYVRQMRHLEQLHLRPQEEDRSGELV
jgi:putative MATE family efflux protein